MNLGADNGRTAEGSSVQFASRVVGASFLKIRNILTAGNVLKSILGHFKLT